ncbi:MAG TPA: fibronectin type III domain-containing protein [Bacteroidia bacterium]|nr:fibronectin type III domain-containing protein [Bacteroidia bacterium]
MKKITSLLSIILVTCAMASAQVLCPTPTNVTVANITATSAAVAWDAMPGAMGYNVRWKPVTSMAWSAMWTTVNSAALNNLIPATQYEVQVQTICSSSNTTGTPSAWTNSLFFTTTSSSNNCLAPTNVTVANITANSAVVAWTAAPGAISYNVQYRPVGNPSWITINTTNTSVTLNGLPSMTQYELHVQSVCGTSSTNLSAWSPLLHFTTTGSTFLCNAPTGITIANITATSAVVAWSPVTGVISYNVRYRPVATMSWNVVNTTSTSVTLNNLFQQTAYDVQVQTVCSPSSNNNNVSAYSSSVTFQTSGSNTACPTPTGLTVSIITTNSALAAWNVVTGAISYNVRYKPVFAGTWIVVNSLTNSLALNGLFSMTQYMVQVQSVCLSSTNVTSVSPFSPSVYFTTLGTTTACLPPTGLTATNITSSSALMNWNSNGSPFYQVRYRASTSLNWSMVGSATNSVQLTGLSGVTVYEAQVRSICLSPSSNYLVFSAWSPSHFFSTPLSPPQFAQLRTDAGYTTLYINFNSEQGQGNAVVRIYDMKGALLRSENVSLTNGDNGFEISISGFTPGIYVAEVESSGNVERQKLFIGR